MKKRVEEWELRNVTESTPFFPRISPHIIFFFTQLSFPHLTSPSSSRLLPACLASLSEARILHLQRARKGPQGQEDPLLLVFILLLLQILPQEAAETGWRREGGGAEEEGWRARERRGEEACQGDKEGQAHYHTPSGLQPKWC